MSDIPDDNFDYWLSDINFDLIATQNDRFDKVSDIDVDNFLHEQKNENTKMKTERELKVFNEFLHLEGEYRKPEEIKCDDLDKYLAKFFMSVKKKDGDQYEPCSIKSYQSSIERYLKEKNYGVSILIDIRFSKSRETLKAKQKYLKSKGKGNKPHAADEITDADLNKMYEAKTLGLESPTSLLHTMWMICTLHFGMRTGKETKNLLWGDIQLRTDADGKEYIILTQERQTKTRPGDNPKNSRDIKPRAYSTPDNPERCPVAAYKMYRDHRPCEMLLPDEPFFLSVNHNRTATSYWYKKKAMGINKLYAIMKNMKDGTDIEDKKITPYSMRKHMIQKLSDHGVAPNEIIQISGHKNVNSINSYSKIKPDKQHEISHLLSNTASVELETESSKGSADHKKLTVNTKHTMNSMNQQHFLSSMFSGNTINGNIHIYLAPPSEYRASSSETVTSNSEYSENTLPSPAKKTRREVKN